jgi:hypothetical protein
VWANAHTAISKHTENESAQVIFTSKRATLGALTLRNTQIHAQIASEKEGVWEAELRNWWNVPLCKQCVTIRFQLALIDDSQ